MLCCAWAWQLARTGAITRVAYHPEHLEWIREFDRAGATDATRNNLPIAAAFSLVLSGYAREWLVATFGVRGQQTVTWVMSYLFWIPISYRWPVSPSRPLALPPSRPPVFPPTRQCGLRFDQQARIANCTCGLDPCQRAT